MKKPDAKKTMRFTGLAGDQSTSVLDAEEMSRLIPEDVLPRPIVPRPHKDDEDDAGILTGKGVSVLLSHVRDIKTSQERGFERIEKRLDKLDEEIDLLHEKLGRALRDIAGNATRIDFLEAGYHQIRSDLEEVKKNQYSCRARLNYEETTGQFQILTNQVNSALTKRPLSTTPPKGVRLTMSPDAIGSTLRYVFVGLFSALAAAAGAVATMWTQFSSQKDVPSARESREAHEPREREIPSPKLRGRNAQDFEPVSQQIDYTALPPAGPNITETDSEVNPE